MNTFKTLSIALVIMMSSCASLRSDYTQGEDDVYHSKKDAKKNNAVYVPEVDVNEIIRQHPPQYGDSAVNRIDESDMYINPNAAAGYPAYKAQQDSLYALYPWLSGYYVSTTPPPFDEREMEKQARREARRLRREQYLYNSYAGYGYGGGYYGNGWNNGFYGNNLSLGFGNGFYGNNWGSPYYNNWNSGLSFGWNSNLGWNWGLGFNNGWNNWNNWGCSPYSYWGSSWCSPWSSWYSPWSSWYSPWYNSWYSPYYYPYYYGDGGSRGSNATERQRGSMGSTNPPNRLSNEAQGGGNRMTPPTAGSGTATPPTAPGAARLEQRNGQTYYIPPAQNRDQRTPAYGTYNRSVDRAEVQNEYYRPPVQRPNTYQGSPQNRNEYRNDNNYARPPQQQAPPTYQRNNNFPSSPPSSPPPSAPSGPRVGGGGGGGQRPR